MRWLVFLPLLACGGADPEGVVRVATSGETTAVIDELGQVWAWGRLGALSGGQAVDSSPTPVLLDGFRDAEQLCFGTDFALMRLIDGAIAVWDMNDPGEPYLVQSLTGSRGLACGGYGLHAIDGEGVPWVLSAAGTSNAVDARLALEGFDVPLVSGDCGGAHCAFIDDNGGLWTWGDNDRGQLGSGTTTTLDTPYLTAITGGVDAVVVGGAHTIALANGEVWGWGANDMGQLGMSDTDDRLAPTRIGAVGGVTHIAAGRAHTLVRFADGTVGGMGANNRGQLGDGTFSTDPVSFPVLVAGLEDAEQVWGEGDYGLTESTSSGYAAWGANDYGQLGNTDFAESSAIQIIGEVGE